MRRSVKINVVLGAASVVLAATAYGMATQAPPVFAQIEMLHPEQVDPETVTLAALRYEESSVVSSRPVFSPDRRPHIAEPDRPPEAIAPPSFPPLALKGVVEIGGARHALLSAPDGDELFRAGDEILGWRLTEIEKDRVLMTLGTLTFAAELGGEAPAQSPAAIAVSASGEETGGSVERIDDTEMVRRSSEAPARAREQARSKAAQDLLSRIGRTGMADEID